VTGVPKWGRSSKRRIRLIQWTRWELVSIALLAFLISILSLLLAQFLATHPFEESCKRGEANSRRYHHPLLLPVTVIPITASVSP
jgi:hypothetical protein